jgi:RNA polymerase sigma-70 factor (ECF subfamily)
MLPQRSGIHVRAPREPPTRRGKGGLRPPREGIRTNATTREAAPLKEEDIQLVARARTGDERAFRALVEKYERAVFTICLRMVRNRDEATDLSQEAFIKTFSSLDRYNPAYAFSSWLFKITSNLCIDYLRKRRISTFAMDEPVESEKGEFTRQYMAPDPTPDETFSRNEKMQKLEAGIAALPEHYRIMLVLRHQEDLSYEEIAESLAIPLGTVKARIHRAREMLRGILEDTDFFA